MVHEDAMLKNLNATGGRIVAEAVMMGLAENIGRSKAHDVVYGACADSIGSGSELFEVLSGNEEVSGKLGEERLRELCDPLRYLGCCREMIDSVAGNLPGMD